MADKRAYFHVDVGYFQNPKVATLVEENPRAVILHLQAIAYCAQHLTDGLAPKRLIMQLAGVEPCSKQCGEQCIGQCDLQCTIENGLLYLPDARTIGVHDYLEHQRSSDQVKSAADKARRAAQSRWADARGNARGNASSNASGNAKRERKIIDLSSELRPDVEELLDQLDRRIEANGAKRPARTKANADAARLLLDRDRRDPEEAAQLIDWATTDEFWRSNFLSMVKFRAKYDQLKLKAGRATQPPADPWEAFRGYDPDAPTQVHP